MVRNAAFHEFPGKEAREQYERDTQRTWKARSEAVGESEEGRDGIDPVRSCWKRVVWA